MLTVAQEAVGTGKGYKRPGILMCSGFACWHTEEA